VLTVVVRRLLLSLLAFLRSFILLQQHAREQETQRENSRMESEGKIEGRIFVLWRSWNFFLLQSSFFFFKRLLNNNYKQVFGGRSVNGNYYKHNKSEECTNENPKRTICAPQWVFSCR